MSEDTANYQAQNAGYTGTYDAHAQQAANIEKLIGAIEPVDQSPTIAALAAALAKAQGGIKPADKSAENPHFRSRYSDLNAIWEACRIPLSENGLAVVQRIRTGPNYVRITTQLLHSSGEWLKDTATWPVVGAVTPQAIGSCTTYGKRYALAALVGVASGEADDDGNAASGKQATVSGAEAVRGALARPQTASAKKVEEPKADVKPAAIPSPQSEEAMQTALRFSTLWEKAKKAGLNKLAFQEYVARILGEPRPSSAMTADNLDQLEAAWTAETKR